MQIQDIQVNTVYLCTDRLADTNGSYLVIDDITIQANKNLAVLCYRTLSPDKQRIDYNTKPVKIPNIRDIIGPSQVLDIQEFRQIFSDIYDRSEKQLSQVREHIVYAYYSKNDPKCKGFCVLSGGTASIFDLTAICTGNAEYQNTRLYYDLSVLDKTIMHLVLLQTKMPEDLFWDLYFHRNTALQDLAATYLPEGYPV